VLQESGLRSGDAEYEYLMQLSTEKKVQMMERMKEQQQVEKSPQYWIQALREERDPHLLVELRNEITKQTADWIRTFFKYGGVTALCELTENLFWRSQDSKCKTSTATSELSKTSTVSGSVWTEEVVLGTLLECLKSLMLLLEKERLFIGEGSTQIVDRTEVAALCLVALSDIQVPVILVT
jgi:hypothetical protein